MIIEKSNILTISLNRITDRLKKQFPKSLRFQKVRTEVATIKGIEVVDALYKESRRMINLFDFSVCDKLENMLLVA